MKFSRHPRYWFFTLFAILCTNTHAVIESDIVVDPPTLQSLGFFVPYVGTQVKLEYKTQGTTAYKRAMDLLEISSGQFAGSILDLQSGNFYDVRFTFSDGTIINKSLQTQSRPLLDSPLNNVITVTNTTELNNAIVAAKAGDVLLLKNGIYTGPITITKGGTKENPVIVRGETLGGVVIESPAKALTTTYCSGSSSLRIEASHTYVENMTIRGDHWGVVISSSAVSALEGVVVRNTKINNVHCGIRAEGSAHRNHYICNNVIQGMFTNEDTGKKTWDNDGIGIAGQGHSVCHNTLSGFGDTIDMPNSGGNIAIDIFANDILWGGDDGLELDGGKRNIRAYRNRIFNSGTGISVQPGGGGPFYLYRNIIYNTGHAYERLGAIAEVYLPFKFKNNPSGLLIFHNTTLRPGPSWQQGESFSNSQMFNNLILGTTGAARFGVSADLQVDFNGFNRNDPFGSNGIRLTLPIFSPPDEILASGSSDWTPYYTPYTPELDPNSAAVNAGKTLFNINDDFQGLAPDLGAIEVGQLLPSYGAALNDPTKPSTVTGVVANVLSESVVELSWTPAIDLESGISGYAIFSNGVQIIAISATQYQHTNLIENSSYSYQVAAINGAGDVGPQSATITVTTFADTTAPLLESVVSAGDANLVAVKFSEPVSITSAQNTSNYSISNGISVNSALLGQDGLTVQLTTSTLMEGINYRLTVNNVADRASVANVIVADSGLDFLYIDKLLIDQIQPSSYLTDILLLGSKIYYDRVYTYSNIPLQYLGLDYFLTANGDKSKSNDPTLVFNVNQNVTVYVGYDAANSVLPSWLQSWTDTGDDLISTDTPSKLTLRLYSQTFAAGSVSLAGNETGNSMYVVLVAPETASGENPGGGNPGGTDPGTTDPGTTDPGTTDPGTTDPGTTDPGSTTPDPVDTHSSAGAYSHLELCFLVLMLLFSRVFRTRVVQHG